MKSYGRAPTFLLATGYEQVRSVAAALAGDREAADTVQLELPETGVCSSDAATSCDVPAAAASESSCCAAPEPVLVGFPTGLSHGRSGEDTLAASLLSGPKPIRKNRTHDRDHENTQRPVHLQQERRKIPARRGAHEPARQRDRHGALRWDQTRRIAGTPSPWTPWQSSASTSPANTRNRSPTKYGTQADVVIVFGNEAKVGPREGQRLEFWDTDEPSERGIEGMERMGLVRDDIRARVRKLYAEKRLTGN